VYIHTRRKIQRCLADLSGHIGKKSLEELINRLNQNDKTSLASEWEIAILFALSKLGHVSYEPDTGGNQHFDLRYTSHDTQLDFLADVTAVSDDGLLNDNPTSHFFNELSRFLGLGKQIKGRLNINLNEAKEGRLKNGKIDLGLPPKGQIPHWIKQNLAAFRSDIYSNPTKPHSFSSFDFSAKIEIQYSPSERSGMGAHYPSTTSIYSSTNNPITNRLKKKAKQFRNTQFEGIGGVFLCDGGSSALRSRHCGGSSMPIDELIENHFQASDQLEFIFVLHPTANYSRVIPTDQNLHTNVVLHTRSTINQKTADELHTLQERLMLALPEPVREGYQAASALKSNWRWHGSFIGGFSLSKNTIKIPSRLLSSLLSGSLSIDEYEKQYSASTSPPSLQEFVRRLSKEGRMIKSIRLEPIPDKDDDWVVIEYGQPDSAISDFKI
jgi:hypothetical protein